MGTIRQFRCTSCQKQWQLSIGHGMRHGVLGRVMEVFSEDIKKKIVADAGAGQLPLFHFNYQAAVCRQCRDVAAVPVLKLIESGRSYVGECPTCGGTAELLDEDSRIVCPNCGNGELEILDIGHWD